ncbi:MAG: excisionase family DNA-binding protein [Dehalococcoidia bacterium]|nr:excisionase family DNA-binding protein [Dehalococcoidia bacterium]
MNPSNDPLNERLLLGVSEAAVLLSVSRSSCYQLLLAGELPVVRLGRSVRIPVAALQKWLDDRTEPWAGL